MKIILLAAGYATRLYPLTLNCPKPLLPIAGRPMLDYILDAVAPIEGIDEVIVVTNSKFYSQFKEWADASPHRFGGNPIAVLDDRTSNDANKRGAVGDIHYVLAQKRIQDDIVVLAGDNLFEKGLKNFGEYCRGLKSPVLGLYDVGNLELVKKYSSVGVDSEGKVVSFQEKPVRPISTWSGIALYYYPKGMIHLIDRYIGEGNNTDQPGNLMSWIYPQIPVYTWKVEGLWYDIGSKEALEEANQVFTKLKEGGSL